MIKTILYIHGMGGGADSRIPSVLNGWFAANRPDVRVVVRTYPFHPGRAAGQIDAWYGELRPDLVIGESLGGVHALALFDRLSTGSRDAAVPKDFPPKGSNSLPLGPAASLLPANVNARQTPPPLLLVSPALNAPRFLYAARHLVRIPAIHRWLNRIYKAREGERQALDFSPATLAAWGSFRNIARKVSSLWHRQEPGCRLSATPRPHAFFGRRDHYRRSGIVSLRAWRRLFGPGTYTCYDGSHYMEEEHLLALLIPSILERL